MRQIGICIAILFLMGCASWQAQKVEVQTQRINSDVGSDEQIENLIEPYKVVLDEQMNVVLAYNEAMLEKGKPESTLTNWFADLLQVSTEAYFDKKVDFSIQNYGGIRRSSLPEGPVTVGLIYELMPFENRLVVLEMSGEVVENMSHKMARSGGWPVSKELRFEIKGDSAKNIKIGDEQLRSDRIYRVAMPDYVANGGDRLGLPDDLNREDPGILLRQALLDELAGIDTLRSVQLDGRIQNSGE